MKRLFSLIFILLLLLSISNVSCAVVYENQQEIVKPLLGVWVNSGGNRIIVIGREPDENGKYIYKVVYVLYGDDVSCYQLDLTPDPLEQGVFYFSDEGHIYKVRYENDILSVYLVYAYASKPIEFKKLNTIY